MFSHSGDDDELDGDATFCLEKITSRSRQRKSVGLRGCGEEEGGAMHSLCCFRRNSYLIVLLKRKTPAASSRCDVGLKKFIKSALQAGYSSQKHTVCEEKLPVSYCH